MQFYIVYIKEAHPTDGRQVGKNTQDGVEFKQPTTELERIGVAKSCVANLKLTLPCLLDGMDNKVGEAYAGWPDRLFVVGHDGTIAFAGGRGPRGFDAKAWEVGIKAAIKQTPKPATTEETEEGADDHNESDESDAKKDADSGKKK